MPIQNASDSQKVDFLWKKIVYGAAKTDIAGNIDATQEPVASPLQIRADKILQDSASIPAVIPGSNSSVVTIYPTTFPVECISTAGIPTPTLTWQTGRTFWVPPEFGSTYQVKVYIAPSGNAANVASKGTQVFATGSGSNDLWVFDYQSGILNFNSNNTPYNGASPISFTGNSVYISGAVYAGAFGLQTPSNIANVILGNITFSGNTISSNQANGNIMIFAPGQGVVQFVGQDAIGLPSGDDTTRPTYASIGYTRFNTSRQSIEYYDGSQWLAPGEAVISSQTINPDGAANIFALSSNTTTAGVLVSINGTLQQPIDSYVIVNNNQIQFTEIPLTTDTVEVRYISVGAVTVASLQYQNTTSVILDAANVNVTGNLLPSANVTYSLGSETLQWKDLWVSGNTVYIGGSALTVANGQLSIGGNTVGSAVTYSNVNVKAYTETMGFANYSNVNVAVYITSYTGNIESLTITNTATSTSTTTGALVVSGGVGISGALYSQNSVITGSGSDEGYDLLTVKGNLTLDTYGSSIKIQPAYPRNAQLIIGSITHNTNPSITLGNPLSSGGNPTSSTINFNTGVTGTPAYIKYTRSSDVWDFSHSSLNGEINFSTYSSIDDGSKLSISGTQGNVKIHSTAQSTSASTGALVVTGGLGVGKNTVFGGNVTVQGNLFVNGNSTIINANNLSINDSMIYLADDNPADTLDIGIVSSFTNPGYQHTGFVRDASDGIWKLFANVVTEPTTTVDFTNATYANLKIGNLIATDITGASGVLSSLAVGTTLGAAGSIRTQTLTVGSGVNGDVLTFGGAGKLNVGPTNLGFISYSDISLTGATVNLTGNARVSGNLTITGNVVTFSGWSVRETNNKLYFAYNGVNKMSLDTGGNLVVTGDVTAFGTIT